MLLALEESGATPLELLEIYEKIQNGEDIKLSNVSLKPKKEGSEDDNPQKELDDEKESEIE